MNTTTFETAKALKDAGLEQPTPAAGQFWYSKSGDLFVSNGIKFRNEINVVRISDGWRYGMIYKIENWVFAPTLEYLYPKLPISCFVSPVNGWKVRDTQTGQVFSDDSAVEAVAKAFLFYNRK